jgi:hypothetical protein
MVSHSAWARSTFAAAKINKMNNFRCIFVKKKFFTRDVVALTRDTTVRWRSDWIKKRFALTQALAGIVDIGRRSGYAQCPGQDTVGPSCVAPII